MTESLPLRPLAVVTGASSGIGLELAAQFADQGFDLLITSATAAIRAAAEGLAGRGVAVQSVIADLSTHEGVEQLYSAIRATGRPVHAIAINAGSGLGGAFTETDLTRELQMIDVNVKSTVHLAKRVLADMVALDEGRILFTSSIAATIPGTFQAVYDATKSFVQSFAEALHDELKDTGITVTALLPGATDTDLSATAGVRAELDPPRRLLNAWIPPRASLPAE